MRRAITVLLESEDYERLQVAAERRGTPPGVLAEAYLRASLREDSMVEVEQKRQAGIAALKGLAELRERLPDAGPVDMVQLIRDGREELCRRPAV